MYIGILGCEGWGYLSPASLRIEFNVPSLNSSFKFPGTTIGLLAPFFAKIL